MRKVYKFIPNLSPKHDWWIFASPKRYVGTLIFISIALGIDLSNFFMKHLLWVPMNHVLLKQRLFIMAFCSIPSAYEFHEILFGDRHKLGPFIWILSVNLGLETIFVIRHGRFVYTDAFPIWIVYGWALIITIIILGFIKSMINYFKSPPQQEDIAKKNN